MDSWRKDILISTLKNKQRSNTERWLHFHLMTSYSLLITNCSRRIYKRKPQIGWMTLTGRRWVAITSIGKILISQQAKQVLLEDKLINWNSKWISNSIMNWIKTNSTLQICQQTIISLEWKCFKSHLVSILTSINKLFQ